MNYRSVVRFAAVTAMTAAAAFSADWQIQDTKIPFAFRAGGTQLPAGSYRITHETGRVAPIFFLSNRETGKSIAFMIPIVVPADNSLEGNQARMTFTCAASDCVFTEVQPGQGRNGFKTTAPKFRGDYGANRTGKPEIARVVVNGKVSE